MGSRKKRATRAKNENLPQQQQEEKKKEDSVIANGNGTTDPSEKSAVEEVQQEPQPDAMLNPFWLMEKALEKKMRNLKKREQHIQQMKCIAEPKAGQIEAMSKMDEVKKQIVAIEELQKLNKLQMSQYKKAFKKQMGRPLARAAATPTPLQTDQAKEAPEPKKEEEQPKEEVAVDEGKKKPTEKKDKANAADAVEAKAAEVPKKVPTDSENVKEKKGGAGEDKENEAPEQQWVGTGGW